MISLPRAGKFLDSPGIQLRQEPTAKKAAH